MGGMTAALKKAQDKGDFIENGVKKIILRFLETTGLFI